MLEKNIHEISEDDLQCLIDNSVIEKKTIEYKLKLTINTGDEKKEFLKDISSFANTSGGDVIFGIRENRKSGKPEALEGLEIENVDQAILKIENIIQTGIEPRVIGIETQHVKLQNSNYAIIIRVPKSLLSPHRVSYRGHGHFYARSTNGKYPLDVTELRVKFNLAESAADRIRKFREERIANIFAGVTPVELAETPKTILHVIPINSFNPAQAYNITYIGRNFNELPPMDGPDNWESGYDGRFNLDGVLTFRRSLSSNSKRASYTQLYKNGIIEAVTGVNMGRYNNENVILSISFEENIIDSLSTYLNVLNKVKVEFPFFVFLTLTGVKGYTMEVRGIQLKKYYIDREILILPEVIVEKSNVDASKTLKPIFDSIWNACGHPSSKNYDENDNWAYNNR